MEREKERETIWSNSFLHNKGTDGKGYIYGRKERKHGEGKGKKREHTDYAHARNATSFLAFL